jgi:hypothetical protein
MTPEMEKVYRDFEAELFKRELSNSENYDKAILASASGGLGLSMAFIKDVVHLPTAQHLWCLKLSWVVLSLAILAVIGSFQLSQRALGWERARALRVCNEEKGAENEVNQLNKATVWTNLAAGVCFVFGVALTMGFVWTNLHRTETDVPKSSNAALQQEMSMAKSVKPTTTKSVPVFDGAPAPTLYKTNPANPAPTPAPAPAPAPAQQKK